MDEQWETILRIARERGDDPLQSLSTLLAEWATSRSAAGESGEVRLDVDRAARCGRPEVIYGPGKSVDALRETVARQRTLGQSVLATRVSPEQAQAVCADDPEILWNQVARTLRSPTSRSQPGRSETVIVLTAGTSDRPVAEEALETLHWSDVPCELITDVGVAGPWRLLEVVPRLRRAAALIVVAGMEGALPSAVAGWVACPVIAVPTSVGYGASLGGIAALLGMLNSCAANVTVVNIDAGFKAGYVAGLIACPPPLQESGQTPPGG